MQNLVIGKTGACIFPLNPDFIESRLLQNCSAAHPYLYGWSVAASLAGARPHGAGWGLTERMARGSPERAAHPVQAQRPPVRSATFHGEAEARLAEPPRCQMRLVPSPCTVDVPMWATLQEIGEAPRNHVLKIMSAFALLAGIAKAAPDIVREVDERRKEFRHRKG